MESYYWIRSQVDIGGPPQSTLLRGVVPAKPGQVRTSLARLEQINIWIVSTERPSLVSPITSRRNKIEKSIREYDESGTHTGGRDRAHQLQYMLYILRHELRHEIKKEQR